MGSGLAWEPRGSSASLVSPTLKKTFLPNAAANARVLHQGGVNYALGPTPEPPGDRPVDRGDCGPRRPLCRHADPGAPLKGTGKLTRQRQSLQGDVLAAAPS